MANENTQKALKAIDKLERVIDDYFTTEIRAELTRLREALESGTDDAISQEIGDTIHGCDTATARLMDIGVWANELNDVCDTINDTLVFEEEEVA